MKYLPYAGAPASYVFRWCAKCGKVMVVSAALAGISGSALAHMDCDGAGDTSRVPVSKMSVNSTAAAKDSISIYNNITDEEIEFATFNAKTYQHYEHAEPSSEAATLASSST